MRSLLNCKSICNHQALGPLQRLNLVPEIPKASYDCVERQCRLRMKVRMCSMCIHYPTTGTWTPSHQSVRKITNPEDSEPDDGPLPPLPLPGVSRPQYSHNKRRHPAARADAHLDWEGAL